MKRALFTIVIVLAAAGIAFALPGPDEKPEGKDAKAEKPGKTDEGDKKKDVEDLLESLKKARDKEKERPKGVNPFERPGAPGNRRQKNPMMPIVKRMEEVEGELAREKTGKEVQIKENNLIKILDKLIVEAEKKEQQQQQSSSKQQKDQKQCSKKDKGQKQGKQKKPINPQASQNRDPNVENQQKKLQELRRPKVSRRPKGPGAEGRWGLLPKHVREDAMDGSADDFDESFRELLEEYYRRLSDSRKRENR